MYIKVISRPVDPSKTSEDIFECTRFTILEKPVKTKSEMIELISPGDLLLGGLFDDDYQERKGVGQPENLFFGAVIVMHTEKALIKALVAFADIFVMNDNGDTFESYKFRSVK